jgi:hypothetical protein
MRLRIALAFAASVALVVFAQAAHAVPSVGASRPDTELADAWDRSTRLGSFAGKPLLVIYEDKDSAQTNAALKADLSRLAGGEKYRSTVALVAIADVSAYDFWPARGFVKDAIKAESKKQNIVIYCDWDGHVRRGLGLNKNASNVVLYGKDGRVAFARAGTLSAAERAEVLDLLRREVGEKSAP